jgi:hypothetical protein
MRVLVVLAVLVGAAFMIVFVLIDLARELSHHSYHSPPDLYSSNDWDVEQNEFEGAVPPVVPYSEQWPFDQYRSARTQGDNSPGNSNALDDLHSAL